MDEIKNEHLFTPAELAIIFTPAELATRYQGQISIKTFANWRSICRGPNFMKVGARVFYPASEVYAWEQSRMTGRNRQKQSS
jgi:hypothetical protein